MRWGGIEGVQWIKRWDSCGTHLLTGKKVRHVFKSDSGRQASVSVVLTSYVTWPSMCKLLCVDKKEGENIFAGFVSICIPETWHWDSCHLSKNLTRGSCPQPLRYALLALLFLLLLSNSKKYLLYSFLTNSNYGFFQRVYYFFCTPAFRLVENCLSINHLRFKESSLSNNIHRQIWFGKRVIVFLFQRVGSCQIRSSLLLRGMDMGMKDYLAIN